MKKTVLKASVLGAWLLSMVAPSETLAQSADRPWGLSVYANAIQARTNIRNDIWDMSNSTWGGGLGINRYLSPSFDVALQLNYFNMKQESGTVTYNVTGYGPGRFDNEVGTANLGLKLKLNNGKILSETAFLQPYLIGGIGAHYTSVEAYLPVPAAGQPGGVRQEKYDEGQLRMNYFGGAGIGFKLTDGISLFAQTTLNYPTTNMLDGVSNPRSEDELNDRYLQHQFGITFGLGKATDTDGDGVSDRRDKCPDTPAGVQVDKNGCPLDGDGDGVPDYQDKCPTEAGTAALEGCPDKDGDGVRDSEDECPDQAGPVATRGCPDADGDGVADKNDTCPNTPAGTRVDANGCPVVLDRDNDGVNDDVDRCPDVAGSASNMGCPGLDAADSTYMARVPKIEFEFNRAVLKKTSYPTLDRMSTMLSKYPHYNLRISGHADHIGSNEYNQELSVRRADAAKSYLTNTKGVASDRIITEGFGEERPVAPNTTNAGRARNRRAEFRLFIQ
ncbi:OmpA family protein [Rufibacter sediminis]|uniref:OmpA family protein n=1 Tax=Rufibacter sediminis TaxID=2762756 RepID=A0ABR6VST5_9BACT|nr:OmpA family protein [Rufibacter sediminis]MBC3540222.1 OmpA family protein [Rufibacter sediminis]